MFQLLKRTSPLLILLAVAANAQISLPTNTYNPPVGTVFQNKIDGSAGAAFFNTVTSGTGGPMTFDFTGHAFSSAIDIYVVSKASTPAADSFPTANLVLMTPFNTDTAWSVHRSVPSAFTRMGTVSRGTSGFNAIVYRDTADDWVFPLNYNNQWTAYRHWRTNAANTYTLAYDTTFNNVNGWGNAKYGSKLVACLRVVSTERYTYKTYKTSNDSLMNTTTATNVAVNFIGAGFVTLASVSKFSSSGSDYYQGFALGDFLNQQTAVDEQSGDNLPNNFALEQNYPNPFNPRTVIRFDLPKRSDVHLTIYNLAGQKVKEIVNGELGPGVFAADWDGTNETGEAVATGVYLYRLDADSFTQTKKMVLMK